MPPYTSAESLIQLDDYPHSVIKRGDVLYIAQQHGLYRVDYRSADKAIDRDKIVRIQVLPGGPGHGSRTIKLGPDNRIYLSLGISGNCSDQYLDQSYPRSQRRGGLMVLDETQQPARLVPYASGLRNPVGFDWNPLTGQGYATNNGPDHLGFEQPPEQLAAFSAGSFHGMPWYQFNGVETVRDDCIDSAPPRTDPVAPVLTFAARNAPMDIAFFRTQPAQKTTAAVVALRGSWGTAPTGSVFGDPASRREPKLVRLRFKQGKPQGVEDLVTGFQLADGRRWARPVGIAIDRSGVIYFTSDSGVNGLFRLRPITQATAN